MSSSDSESSSSSESSRNREKKEKKKEKKRKREKDKKEKKDKAKKSRREKTKKDKKKGKKRSSEPVQLSKFMDGSDSEDFERSVISGKRIKRKIDKSAKDIANDANRAKLLEFLNETYD